MGDRPGERKFPDNERPLASWHFRDVDGVRGESRQKAHPDVGNKGLFRRANFNLGDSGATNLGDALNQYEQYLQTSTSGSSLISEFMNINNSQANIVLSDFVSNGQDGAYATAEMQFFAASDNVKGAPALEQAAVDVGNQVLPGLFGKDWSKWSGKWDNLDSSHKAAIAEQVMTSRTGGTALTLSDIETLISNAATSQEYEDIGIAAGAIIGAILVLGIVVVVVSRV